MINQELLKKASRFENPEDAKIFDEVVVELIKTEKPAVITSLIELFDDDSDHPEVMFSLVHALESLSDDLYFESLLNAIEKKPKNSLGWLKVLIFRILNDPKSLGVFKEKIGKVKQDKSINIIFDIFTDMQAESLDHFSLIEDLKHELINCAP